MIHVFQLVVAFVLYFGVTYAINFGINKFPTLVAVIIPGVFAYGVLLLLTPHDTFGVRVLYGVGLAAAAFLQHLFGKTLDKLGI